MMKDRRMNDSRIFDLSNWQMVNNGGKIILNILDLKCLLISKWKSQYADDVTSAGCMREQRESGMDVCIWKSLCKWDVKS